MPLYDFKCEGCGYTEEVFIKLDEKYPKCPKCNQKMDKVISSVPFILKGSGWAHDSYGLKNKEKRNEDKNKGSS